MVFVLGNELERKGDMSERVDSDVSYEKARKIEKRKGGFAEKQALGRAMVSRPTGEW